MSDQTPLPLDDDREPVEPITRRPVELQERDDGDTATALEPVSAVDSLLQLAVSKDLDVDKLERLIALRHQQEDRAARQSFFRAMRAFQAACPQIPKTSTAVIDTRGGTRFSYTYAELDTIARAVASALEAQDLAYSWDSGVSDGYVTATCHIRHVDGHSESSRFTCPVETGGRMSPAQRHAAALTYAKRQSLVSALGLTTTEPDTDAHVGATATISEAQQQSIEKLIADSGADPKRFLDYLQVDSVPEIRATQYASAVSMLQEKKRRRILAPKESP